MILLIAATWLLAAVLIRPQGNFPLYDDWAYASSVKSFLATGSIRLSDWVSPNFIAQMFWGWLFCLPAGFSFTALRISTLVLGLVGIFASYGLFVEIGASRGVALLGALSLAANPLYMVLSYTFMTDVPFLAFWFLSLYFLAKGMTTDSRWEIAGGLMFACVALLIRQTGLALFIAAGLAYLAKRGWRARALLLATLTILLGVLVQLSYQRWLESTGRMPADYRLPSLALIHICSHMSLRSVVLFVRPLIAILVYLGVFSFPFLMFLGPRRLISLFRFRYLTSMTVFFCALMAYFLRDKGMPLLGVALYDLGLGGPLLYDTETLHLHHFPAAGKTFWTVVTVAGAVGAVFLLQAALVAIVEVCRPRKLGAIRRPTMVLLLAAGVVYIAPLMPLGSYSLVFDRYVIPLLPLAMLVLVQSLTILELPKVGSRFMPLAALALVLCAAFSVAGTHDYLSWNRARWQALNDLMQERHLSPKNIDGGYEFNGWYLFGPGSPNPELSYYINEILEKSAGVKSRSPLQPTPIRSWWWVESDDYVVTFGPVPGFKEVRRCEFRRWLPPGKGTVLILQRASTEAKLPPVRQTAPES